MKIWHWLCLFLVMHASTALGLATNNSALYSSAEKIIESEPLSAVESVNAIFTNYRNLEIRWIGKDNVIINHEVIKDNPLFAKTNIFTEGYRPESQFVKYFRLKYTTDYQNQHRNVGGLVLLPPQKQPKGIILFFHSTMTGKLRVPSLKFDEYKTQMLAAIFAANGYVVVAPDYIGLGDDYGTSHPYILYPKANVDDGYNMLLASKKLLIQNGIKFDQSLPLFISGYSEGSSYALWFSRIYQENTAFRKRLNVAGYRLAMTVPIDGAYDVSGVMFPFLLGNQINESQNTFHINSVFWGTILKPSLLANALLGFATHNNIPAQSLFNQNFYRLKCVNGLPWCTSSYSGYTVDSVRFINASQLKMALNYYFQAFGISAAKDEPSYGLFNNSVTSLISPQFLSAESSLLYQTARDADINKWKSTNPVVLVSLAKDSLVPETNSQNAYTGMMASGSSNLKYIKVDNNLLKARAILGPSVADHVSFELYALLIALKEFNSLSSAAVNP